jgi:membrane fusion protein (multidrug efflux system)
MRAPYFLSFTLFTACLLYNSGVFAQPGGRANLPTSVVVSPVQTKNFIDEVEALGTLRANESVSLASSVTELVTAIYFTDGQRVTKDMVLVEMDAAEEFAILAEEQSRLDEAEQQLARARPLARSGAGSKAVLDQRQREVDTAKARITAIQSRIGQRRIRAPFDGVLGLRNISVGALAQPGTIVATIDDDSIMKLDFSVPSVFLSTLAPGVAITAKARAFENQFFNGTISSIDSRVDPITRSIQVRALIENPDQILKPGILMQIVVSKNPRDVMVLPEEALIADGDKSFVYVAEEAEEGLRAAKRVLEIGARRKGEVEVLAGLNVGDRVITHGNLKMRPNAPIKIMSVQMDNEPLVTLIAPSQDQPSGDAP